MFSRLVVFFYLDVKEKNRGLVGITGAGVIKKLLLIVGVELSTFPGVPARQH